MKKILFSISVQVSPLPGKASAQHDESSTAYRHRAAAPDAQAADLTQPRPVTIKGIAKSAANKHTISLAFACSSSITRGEPAGYQ